MTLAFHCRPEYRQRRSLPLHRLGHNNYLESCAQARPSCYSGELHHLGYWHDALDGLCSVERRILCEPHLIGNIPSPQETLVEIVVEDIFFTQDRGFYRSVYSWALFCDAFLSPVASRLRRSRSRMAIDSVYPGL
ncbi:hypothetical protein BDV10DRAFT_172943 [Aspergillus recurvatus]